MPSPKFKPTLFSKAEKTPLETAKELLAETKESVKITDDMIAENNQFWKAGGQTDENLKALQGAPTFKRK